MNPIQRFLENLFAKKRVLGNDSNLIGLAKADQLLGDLVLEQRVPGLSITMLKQGQMVFQKGYGHSDLEKKTPVSPTKTIFRIASVSKPIAATALAYMVADGQIDLDASFYDYVPYYPKKKWDFTIRQLAGHTAGIRGYQGVEYGLDEPYTIKEGLAIFKDDDLVFEPGTDYLYNSFDWVLVSLAMQEASGIPFEDYVRKKILEPLGMDNTFPEHHPANHLKSRHHGRSGTTVHIAKSYSTNRQGFRPAKSVHNFYKLAGGGYLSTSEDITKFGQACLDGRILNGEVRSQFLTSQRINGEPTYYGLGWQVSQDAAGRPFYGHVGNGVGGYSNFFVYPKARAVIAILINCTDPKVQDDLDLAIDFLLKDRPMV